MNWKQELTFSRVEIYEFIRGLCLLTFPGLLVLVLQACNSINPVAGAFMTRFSVTNDTAERIVITPVGALGPEGWRMTLPMLFDLEIYLHHFRSRKFVVEPGETRRLVYDSDDIQFSEIVVEQGGEKRVIIVDPEPTKRQYTPPVKREFVVSVFRELPIARPDVARAADIPFVPFANLYSLSSVIGIACFVYLGRKVRRQGL